MQPSWPSHPKANADEQATAMYYAGKTHYKKNDLNAAKDNFDRAGKKANNNQAAESRYLVAEILYKQGDKSGAEAQCNAANDANASYPFWIAKSLLLLSDIYVDRNDLFNARAALEAVIENFSDDKDLLASANEKLVNVENLEKQNTRIKPAATSSNLLEMQSGGGN
jgi:TolA-binding protein